MTSPKKKQKPTPWTREQDQLFWHLVETGSPEQAIAVALKRTPEELRRRGYVLGLPAKWFKEASAPRYACSVSVD